MSGFVGTEPTVMIAGLGWLGAAGLMAGAFVISRRRPAWGLGLVLAATPLYQFRGTLGLPVTLLELILGAVLLGWLVNYRKYPLQPERGWIWLGVLVAGGLAAAVLSPDPRMGLGLWRAFLFEPALYLLAATAILRKESARPLLVGLVGSLGVLTVYAFVRGLVGTDLTYDGRILGPYQSANFLAMATVPVILASVFWPAADLPRDRFRRLSVRLIPAGLAGVLLLLSQSRGGLISLVAGLVVGGLFTAVKVTRRQLVAGLLALAVATAVVVPLAFVRAEPIVPVRRMLVENAAEFIRDKPLFGVGPNQFQARLNERYYTDYFLARYYLPFAPNAHNLLLVLWSEWGVITLAGFLGLVVTTGRRLVTNQGVATAVPAAVLAAMLAHGLVDTPVLKNDLALLFMAMVALAWTAASATSGRKRPVRTRSARHTRPRAVA